MTLEIELKDINGNEIKEGSKVCAYVQDYVEMYHYRSDDAPIVVLDHTKPKPIKDVPLFIGKVVWNNEQLAFEILIEKMMTDWNPIPSSIKMGGGAYAYELIN